MFSSDIIGIVIWFSRPFGEILWDLVWRWIGLCITLWYFYAKIGCALPKCCYLIRSSLLCPWRRGGSWFPLVTPTNWSPGINYFSPPPPALLFELSVLTRCFCDAGWWFWFEWPKMCEEVTDDWNLEASWVELFEPLTWEEPGANLTLRLLLELMALLQIPANYRPTNSLFCSEGPPAFIFELRSAVLARTYPKLAVYLSSLSRALFEPFEMPRDTPLCPLFSFWYYMPCLTLLLKELGNCV